MVSISTLNFGSFDKLKISLANQELKTEEIASLLSASVLSSETKTYRLSRVLIENTQKFSEAKEVFNWAKNDSKKIKMMVRAYKNSNSGFWFVQSVAGESHAKKVELFKAYFNEGGSAKDAALWISRMGLLIKKAKAYQAKNYDGWGFIGDAWDATGGKVVGAIEDGFEALGDLGADFIDGLTKLVKGVVKSLLEAGKSFLELVGDVAKFTYDELKDFVSAIIEIGEDIGEFLVACAGETFKLFKNALKALIAAGKTIGNLLQTALEVSFDFLKESLNAIFAIVQIVGDILRSALRSGYNILKSTINAMIEIGKSVAYIIKGAFKLGFNLLKSTIQVLIEVGNTFAYILYTALTDPGNLFQESLRAFQRLGHTLKNIMKDLVNEGKSFIQKVGKSLIKIGESVKAVFDSVLDAGYTVIAAIAQGMYQAGKLAVNLIKYAVNKGQELLTVIFKAVVEMGQIAFSLLKDALKFSYSLLNKATVAFFEIGGTVFEFVTSALKNTYALSAKFISAALEAGKSVVEVLSTVVEKSYFLVRETVNGILKAVGLDAVADVLDWAFSVSDKLVKFTTKAIRYVTHKATDVLNWAVAKGAEALNKVVNILDEIGTSIRDILNWTLDKSYEITRDIVSALRRGFATTTYVLAWAAGKSFEFLDAAIDGIIAVGDMAYEVIAWTVNRSYEFMKHSIDKLFALGVSISEIVLQTIVEPSSIFKNIVKVFYEVGKTFYDIFTDIKDLAVDVLNKVWETIKLLGMSVLEVLNWAAAQSLDILRFSINQLLDLGVAAAEVVVWSVSQAFDIAFFALDIIDAVVSIWDSIIEALLDLAGDKIGGFFEWLITKSKDVVDWLVHKVIQPLIAIAKVALIIAIIASAIVAGYGLIVLLVLAALFLAVKVAPITYDKWPKELIAFKNYLGQNLLNLPSPEDDKKYVIFSDIHRDTQSDIDGNIGHFYKNKNLFMAAIDYYGNDADADWTMIENGDCEELWFNTYLTLEHSPASKIDDVMREQKDLNDKIKTLFHDDGRYFRLRGNHDDYWTDDIAMDKLQEQFPGIKVYESALIEHPIFKDFLIMHGHQFDDVNCDEHNWFGKIVVELVASSVDVIELERWDAWADEFGLDIDSATLMIAPFYEHDEWEDEMSKVTRGKLDSGIMFDESRMVDFSRALNDVSMIFGHTHAPKITYDPNTPDKSRMYINNGNTGWWEDVVWALEIHHDKVALVPWVLNDNKELVVYNNKTYTNEEAASWYVS